MAETSFYIYNYSEGVIVLDANFNAASLPTVNVSSSDSKNYTRYVLYPIEKLKFAEVSRTAISSSSAFPRISSYYRFTNSRSGGSFDITMQIFEGTIGNLVAVGEQSTAIIFGSHDEPYLHRGYDWYDQEAIDLANEMLSTPHTVTYNNKQYFCIRYRFSNTLYKGTITGLSTSLTFKYDDTSKIFNGSNAITSAYLGSTPINGIYLGSNKLL